VLEPERHTATFEPAREMPASDLATGTVNDAPAADAAATAARSAAIDEQEYLSDVLRMRSLIVLALMLYPAFGIADWSAVVNEDAGPWWWFAVLRVVGSLVIAAAYFRIRRTPIPTPFVFGLIQHGVFTFGPITVVLMGVDYGGIATPYSGGVMIFIIALGAVMAQPWRRGVVALGLPALSFPLIMLGTALFSPRVAAQLHDPAALTIFGTSTALICATWFTMTMGSHIMWTIRRQLYETRAIGRYRLRRRIGIGGMGEVWAAYHPALKRDVALKILRTDAGAKARIARFEREVKATSELTHPNTVRIFDYGVTEDGIRYYVMELLDGANLAEFVRRDGPLAPARAAHVVGPAARAVAEAHARGIIHRDLKPENLIVSALGGERDFVKVVDFGIAKMNDDGATTLTQGVWIGTPAYLAPEVVRGRPADARSDVYCLGGVLFYCLTGRPPFTGGDAAAVLRAHIEDQPPRASDVATQAVPEHLEAVLARCFAKNPADRYAHAGELAAALIAHKELA
jgi:serine/threonine-protein kinase